MNKTKKYHDVINRLKHYLKACPHIKEIPLLKVEFDILYDVAINSSERKKYSKTIFVHDLNINVYLLEVKK